ncbi:MAG: AcvB/VirJ family lysyl-phosphatidylglycerol hydrolase [Acidobacteriota bacterium]
MKRSRFAAALLIAAAMLQCSGRDTMSVPSIAAAGEVDPGSCRQQPLSGLPLVERSATGNSDNLVIFLSGDGGWRRIDQRISDGLNAAGLPVVGFLSNVYFSNPRSPAETACDMEALIDHSLRALGKKRVLLVGYSRGADALPLIVNRLSPATRARVSRIGLLNPAVTAQLHSHHWWQMHEIQVQNYELIPEMLRLTGVGVTCIYGSEEEESLCSRLPAGSATVIRLHGGHHFGGAYSEIARLLVAALAGDSHSDL